MDEPAAVVAARDTTLARLPPPHSALDGLHRCGYQPRSRGPLRRKQGRGTLSAFGVSQCRSSFWPQFAYLRLIVAAGFAAEPRSLTATEAVTARSPNTLQR